MLGASGPLHAHRLAHDLASMPVWLAEALDALAEGRLVGGAVGDPGEDTYDALTFLRTLDRALPVEVEDVGDAYWVRVPTLGVQLVLALVGGTWSVEPL